MTLADELHAARVETAEARRELAHRPSGALDAMRSADLHAEIARAFADGLGQLKTEGVLALKTLVLTARGRFLAEPLELEELNPDEVDGAARRAADGAAGAADELARNLDDADGADLTAALSGAADRADDAIQQEGRQRPRARGTRGGKRHRRRA